MASAPGAAKQMPADMKAQGPGGTGTWSGYSTMEQVQTLLERNKVIIHQVQINHERRTPEALLKNQGLLEELNRNVATVVQLYETLAQDI